MTKRLLTSLLAAVVVAFTAAACGGDDDDGTGDGATTATDESSVALLLFSRGFEFMVALDQGAQDEADQQGIDLTVLDGQGDSATQIGQIEDQIAAGVDALVISPNNSEEIVPGIERANEAGVPVVTVDAISAGGDVASHVGFDNEAAGREAASYLADAIGEDGTVLELTGAQGAFHAVRRGEGFNSETSDQFSDVEVLERDAEWTADNALSITTDTFTADPEVAGIFSHNDEMIRGVTSGLGQVGRGAPVGEDDHVVVVGIDGTPLALERIRNGEQDATIQQDPFEMGSIAIQMASAVLNGEEVPEETLLEPLVITQDNADDPDLWGNVFEE